MKIEVDLQPIRDFLPCETPQAWVDWALQNPELMLVDHANCEKKAASTALNLMYRYVEHHHLLNRLSKLAREELRHFEQVIALMKRRGVEYSQISAARYAGGLRDVVRSKEPGRLVDTLIVGAVIEARSCERFAALVPVLDDELARFYHSLLKSESRHFSQYLEMAAAVSSPEEVEARRPSILERERQLVLEPDQQFRFHSGPPSLELVA